ncbi:MAG: hypothetical protein Q8928_16640 [Bacteroidota bacterium]|nr:hypothetical protein [Bacteroidota bacterium]
MKKVKYIILWSVIAIYLVITVGFVVKKRAHLVCTGIEVRIVDSLKNAFVSDEIVKKLLQRKGYKLVGKNFDKICLDSIESVLNDYPPVEKSEVYKTSDGNVVIEIRQRNPILRVIDNNNTSYYIDDKGYIMRFSGNYTSDVIVANGNILTKFPLGFKVNVIDLEENAQGRRIILAELYKLAKFITGDKFWNAQIQQIFVNQSGDFELVPRVGSNLIIFGDISDCETKFSNLMSLYKNGFPATGWNKYETINLKYKGQVICTKRE